MFVASQAADGLNPSTLTRRLAAIRLVHIGAGNPSPHNTIQVTEMMRGIRRDWGRPPDRKAPAIKQVIKQMVDTVGQETAKGQRRQRRKKALMPYLDQRLVCVCIRLPGVIYTIEIGPETEKVVHWEWQPA